MFSNIVMLKEGLSFFVLGFVVFAVVMAFAKPLFRYWDAPVVFWCGVLAVFALLIGFPLWDWWTADDPGQFVARFTSPEPVFTREQLWAFVKFRFWGCVIGSIAGLVGWQVYLNRHPY